MEGDADTRGLGATDEIAVFSVRIIPEPNNLIDKTATAFRAILKPPILDPPR